MIPLLANKGLEKWAKHINLLSGCTDLFNLVQKNVFHGADENGMTAVFFQCL